MDNSSLTFGNIKENLAAFIRESNYTKVFILVDENTKKLCLPLLAVFDYNLIEIKSGEQNKNIETCQYIWQQLLVNNADRNALLINLGGGVISDMGGFCAAVYKRGISFINIPTTLLAMVDATIGGKTGIDFNNHKNMIGLFSNANKIFIDNTFLNTLDLRQIKSGKAEMLKHGLIANENHFNKVLENERPSIDTIKDSIAIKESIVNKDPFEKGLRKSLNFGHTLGHALESYYLENDLDILHGEAVAQGMIWALQLSVKYTGFNSSKANEKIKQITAVFGEKNVSKNELDILISLAKNDKKNNNGKINFCLLKDIAQVEIDFSLTEQEIKTAL